MVEREKGGEEGEAFTTMSAIQPGFLMKGLLTLLSGTGPRPMDCL